MNEFCFFYKFVFWNKSLTFYFNINVYFLASISLGCKPIYISTDVCVYNFFRPKLLYYFVYFEVSLYLFLDGY